EDGKCDVGVYAKGRAQVTLDNFVLSESADTATRVPLLKGGEISKLTYIEDMGGKFYRADGSEADALQIMAENGFNLARIRILNDPGKGHGADGYYLPAGYQDEADCLELCRRAKDKGMQIEFTFAYSDYWTDGDKQMIPHEWAEEIASKGLSGWQKYDYLENKVYEYTKDIMLKLIAQGTCPDFVSIGNEMQGGLFFGNAKANGYKHEDLYYTDWDRLTKFVNAGARAVRETAPDTKVVLHSDNGGKAILWEDTPFYWLMTHADFDVMAVSYYPFYNGDISIDDVVAEFNKCVATFNKDVMIMESGYNWTEFKPDGWDGQLQNNGFYQNIYGETQNGQRAYLTELYSKLKSVSGGRCIGVSYWDPVMIYDGGTGRIGWAVNEETDATETNVVPNSTLFDFEGRALAGQLAMKYDTNSSDRLLLAGRSEPETDITLTVNDGIVTTRSDKFGDYIAAVDHPAGEKLNIYVNGMRLSLDAPEKGVLLKLPTYENKLSADSGTVTARFAANTDLNKRFLGALVKYDNGDIADVKAVKFTSGERKTVELAAASGDLIKSFLWSADTLEPMTDAQSLAVE
ncbi:MAG: glycosyl hydrolase 53 family protein, partial [Clostridia bacterium]|nr:glycosyl hydrolase 53 family protein [Clostridia bacterium]